MNIEDCNTISLKRLCDYGLMALTFFIRICKIIEYEVTMIIKPKEIKMRKFVRKPNISQAVIIATEMLKFAEFDRIEEKYNKQLKDLLECK